MENNLLQQFGNALPNEVRVTAFQSNLTGGQRSALDGEEGTGLSPSYFDLTISDSSGQLDGVYDSFCLDTDRFLGFEGYDFNNDGDTTDSGIVDPILGRIRELDPIEFSAQVYSSYEALPAGLIEKPENLDLINWIINQDFVGQASSSGEVFTVADVQQAIWQLADNDAGVTEGDPFLDALFDGFDNARIAEIVTAAQSNGEGFVPGFGQKVAVILVPDGNDGAADGQPDGQVIFAAVDVNKIIEPASLGNKVFLDADRDGIQDAGEVGVEGVTVTLTGGGADGVIGTGDDTTAQVTTDANGMYRFDDLNPGEEYKVTFSDLPNGFEFTQANAGADDALDSDADPANGMTQVVTLAPGEFNDTLDAGIVEPANPNIDIKKFVNGFDANTAAEAVKIAAGDEVTFTYAVKNTGDVAFAASEVVITDDNGTPGYTSDDFNPLFVDASDLNSNGKLDVGETWLYTASQTAQNLATTTSSEDLRFYLTGHSYTDGHDGNSRTFTAGDVSAEVSAFSSDKHGNHFEKAYVGAYSGGLGVTNRYEDGSLHRVDNGYSLDYLVFEFDQDVTVDKAFLDYVGHDSDISVWIGDRDGADLSHLDSSILNSFVKEDNFTHSSSSRWADFNNGGLEGDTLVISAYTGGSNDAFKLKKLDVSVAGETVIGNYENVATVLAGDVSDSDTGNYTNPESAESTHILVEAEDMHRYGYSVEHLGDIASGGEAIALHDHWGKAKFDFAGPSGEYDIIVGYYDENDGHARGKLLVGGDAVDHWTFDEHTDSRFASSSNLRERTIENVSIDAGEQIKFLGVKDGYEYARIDYIKVVSADSTGASSATPALEDTDLFAYANSHAPGLVSSGALSDALI
ncbi:MAG: SdrD B-like domain-containing protein [Elainellaceae cyanobacterium]